ncbi:MAG: type II secretion system protein, partial [Candidatus Magasanikbacteria bacterium]|nr:type II secretion system protein [Candidatus Magasanikbacteria bacterium]
MAAQRVSGLWFIVNGLKKTINYRLSTPIKSESTINYHRFGFSLIELMIVIALFSITTIVVTTSYISFQGREILKNAALQLKSDLRQAQNSAQVGDKVSNDDVGCASYDTSTTTVSPTVLGGWYLYITNGGTSYTISGVCMDKAHSYFERPFGSKTSNFPNGVTISSITCGPPATGTLADGDNF